MSVYKNILDFNNQKITYQDFSTDKETQVKTLYRNNSNAQLYDKYGKIPDKILTVQVNSGLYIYDYESLELWQSFEANSKYIRSSGYSYTYYSFWSLINIQYNINNLDMRWYKQYLILFFRNAQAFFVMDFSTNKLYNFQYTSALQTSSYQDTYSTVKLFNIDQLNNQSYMSFKRPNNLYRIDNQIDHITSSPILDYHFMNDSSVYFFYRDKIIVGKEFFKELEQGGYDQIQNTMELNMQQYDIGTLTQLGQDIDNKNNIIIMFSDNAQTDSEQIHSLGYMLDYEINSPYDSPKLINQFSFDYFYSIGDSNNPLNIAQNTHLINGSTSLNVYNDKGNINTLIPTDNGLVSTTLDLDTGDIQFDYYVSDISSIENTVSPYDASNVTVNKVITVINKDDTMKQKDRINIVRRQKDDPMKVFAFIQGDKSLSTDDANYDQNVLYNGGGQLIDISTKTQSTLFNVNSDMYNNLEGFKKIVTNYVSDVFQIDTVNYNVQLYSKILSIYNFDTSIYQINNQVILDDEFDIELLVPTYTPFSDYQVEWSNDNVNFTDITDKTIITPYKMIVFNNSITNLKLNFEEIEPSGYLRITTMNKRFKYPSVEQSYTIKNSSNNVTVDIAIVQQNFD